MEFKEQSSKQVATRNFEVSNNGHKYIIIAVENEGALSIEMKIYIDKEITLEDGYIQEEKSSFPVGVIYLKDGTRRVAAEGDIDQHIAIFDEFIKTL